MPFIPWLESLGFSGMAYKSLLDERNQHVQQGPFNVHPIFAAKQLVNRLWEKGLLMNSAGTHSNIIRPLMPLVITEEQLERGLYIIEECLSDLSST